MANIEQSAGSRSLAIYGLLLALYPRPYLHRHRAEMLQNFQDLEQVSPSKPALWLFLARDLVVSLRPQFTRTLWGQTSMVVAVLAMILVYTEHHAVARLYPTEAGCLGYILGWFAGWFGRQWHASSISRVPSYVRSLPAQVMIVVSVLGLAIGAVKFGVHPQSYIVIWTLCYGFLTAWGPGWLGCRRQARS
jgi:hypothetical protein